MRRPLVAGLVLVASVLATPMATGAATTTTTTRPATPTTYGVVRTDVTWTDTTRGTAVDNRTHTPAKSTRTLGVMILRPDAPGRFPLVVFIHGVTASGPAYEGLLRPWAAAGFVVAAPTEPLTSGPGAWDNLGDYVNQPGDIRFVIDRSLHDLSSHVDGDHVAVAGHSLGAITTIGSVFNSCCRDARVDAAIEISGVELPFPSGSFTHLPAVPLLAIHGAADTTVPVAGSDTLYAAAQRPAYYLRITKGGHVDILGGDAGALVQRTAIAFLRRYLGDQAGALDGVRADAASHDLATWRLKLPVANRAGRAA